QTTVALSSCEAEFMAATTTACQAIWLRELLAEVTGLKRQKVIIRVDNKSAIALSKNPVFHGRSKHIHTRYHFIRECVENEQVIVEHVSGENQRVDPLTKALARISRPPPSATTSPPPEKFSGEPKITPGHPIYLIYYITRHHSPPLSPFVHTTTPPPTPRNATSHHSPPQSPFPPTYNTTTAAQPSVAAVAATPAGTLITTIQPPPHCHVHHPVTLSTVTIYHVTTSPGCPHHQHHHSRHSPASPPPDPPSEHHRCHHPSATNPSPPSSYRRVFVSGFINKGCLFLGLLSARGCLVLTIRAAFGLEKQRGVFVCGITVDGAVWFYGFKH
nr:zinc finger, CCHC-type [Tanacetum cinerariifolium]